jgi:hypothetical protein
MEEILEDTADDKLGRRGVAAKISILMHRLTAGERRPTLTGSGSVE